MVERITPGQTNPPAQITGTQKKSGEEAFHDLAKSEGDIEDIKNRRSEATRLTRTKGKRTEQYALFEALDNDELLEEPVFRTVMVDGMLFTLRLLAIA